MKKYIPLPLLFVLLVASVYSQEFEYGKPSELKGLTKVFIDTGPDIKSHDQFVKKIEKSKIAMLTLVENPDEAEIFLVLAGGKTMRVIGSGGDVMTKTKATGTGYVAIQGRNKTTPRIVMSFDYVRRNRFSDAPGERFAEEFLKQYKIANGLK